jgi:hypothetical protein
MSIFRLIVLRFGVISVCVRRSTPMVKTVWLFVLLQVSDVASTLAGFRVGAIEGNPIVRQFLGPYPVYGLITVKLLALGIAGLALALKRQRVLRLVNPSLPGC